MNELVLDVVGCYENRVSMVEELAAEEYYNTPTLDASLATVSEESARLETSLRDILARNCHVRRKDFCALMERYTAERERGRRELEEERERIRGSLIGYLDEQKQSATSLRQQLVDFHCGKTGRDAVESTMAMFKAACRERGEEMLATIRSFQLRLVCFRVEQEEMNHKLQRLVDRGESLRLEDLRRLEAVKAGEERRVGRELRRQEVEGLLAHFRDGHQRAAK